MLAVLLPSQGGGNVKVDVDALRIAQVGADVVVGGDLRHGAGAAGPAGIVVELAALEIDVGVVKGATVGLQRLGAKDGVVHHAFHAVAIPRIAGDTHEVAG